MSTATKTSVGRQLLSALIALQAAVHARTGFLGTILKHHRVLLELLHIGLRLQGAHDDAINQVVVDGRMSGTNVVLWCQA